VNDAADSDFFVEVGQTTVLRRRLLTAANPPWHALFSRPLAPHHSVALPAALADQPLGTSLSVRAFTQSPVRHTCFVDG
jgi:hypothetical protein